MQKCKIYLLHKIYFSYIQMLSHYIQNSPEIMLYFLKNYSLQLYYDKKIFSSVEKTVRKKFIKTLYTSPMRFFLQRIFCLQQITEQSFTALMFEFYLKNAQFFTLGFTLKLLAFLLLACDLLKHSCQSTAQWYTHRFFVFYILYKYGIPKP